MFVTFNLFILEILTWGQISSQSKAADYFGVELWPKKKCFFLILNILGGTTKELINLEGVWGFFFSLKPITNPVSRGLIRNCPPFVFRFTLFGGYLVAAIWVRKYIPVEYCTYIHTALFQA